MWVDPGAHPNMVIPTKLHDFSPVEIWNWAAPQKKQNNKTPTELHVKSWNILDGMINLPETNIAPENGWLEYDRCLLGRPIFRCYVCFRERKDLFQIAACILNVSTWTGHFTVDSCTNMFIVTPRERGVFVGQTL